MRVGRIGASLAGLFVAIACSAGDEADPSDEASTQCAAGQSWCGECTDVQANLSHCGACNTPCGLGEDCVNGVCSCLPGQTDCNGTCVNTNESAQNCGTCGNACGAGLVCSNGTCATSCAVGQTQCEASCANLQTSTDHCGSCDNTCDPGTACVAGVCQCTQGRQDCGAGCTDLFSDPLNCGTCGLACAQGEACVTGLCQPVTSGTGGASGTGGLSGTGGTSTGGTGGTSGTGDGFLIDGTCQPACATASDPDGDGWGWENEASCVVPGTSIAQGRPACDPSGGTGGATGTGGTSTGGAATGGTSTGGAATGGTGSGGTGGGGNTCTKTGFYVQDGGLFDSHCNEFIMRGINYPYTWYTQQTQQAFASIAAIGSNSVRVVLSSGDRWTKTTGANLTQIINWAKQNRLVTVAEVHDMTGWSEQSGSVGMTNIVNYWTSQDVKSALIGQEAYVIINIANEPTGNGDTHSQWQSVHASAINALRNAGLHHTLMVDAPNWGQDHTNTMRDGNGATTLFNGDPDKNVVFSVHMYDVYANASAVNSYFTSFLAKGLPLVVGEFADNHPRNGTNYEVAEDAIMQQAEMRGLGYLGWSWSGNSSDLASLDIVQNFNANSRTTWGNKLITGANGITATASDCTCFD
jgi:mannan endo-1,4-beta-mannosidase